MLLTYISPPDATALVNILLIIQLSTRKKRFIKMKKFLGSQSTVIIVSLAMFQKNSEMKWNI